VTCRRDKILDAAERLLRHYGFGKTTVADIAREAGVGVGSVYLDFVGKDAIVGELSARRHGRILDAMAEVATDDGRAFEERLRLFFERRMAGFFALKEAGAHGDELVHCRCSGVQEAAIQASARQRELLVSLLAGAHAAGALDAPEPERTARALLRAYVSFAPPLMFTQDRASLEAALPGVHDLVLRGLLRR
jgi:AcrR family transcriptional regulator